MSKGLGLAPGLVLKVNPRGENGVNERGQVVRIKEEGNRW